MVADEDIILSTLMAYREASNQGDSGITAVLCVARNNAFKHKASIYTEVTKAFRYSSINCPLKVTAKNTAQAQSILADMSRFADQNNTKDWALWLHIKGIVAGVLSGTTEDITNGATLYYATSMSFPKDWDATKVQFCCQIGSQKFYREL